MLNVFKPQLVDLQALPFCTIEDAEGGTRVVTVRMPKLLHEALSRQAHEVRSSVNLLCISRLIAAVDGCAIVPANVREQQRKFIEWRDSMAGKATPVSPNGAPVTPPFKG